MNAPNLFFPDGGSISALAEFSKSISEHPEQRRLLVGAGHVSFLRPTCMILLAKVCRTRGRMYPGEQLAYRGLDQLSYPNNFGFSEALNLKGQPFRQGAFGGKSYIPISIMTRERLEEDAANNADELGDAIERRSRNIARIVSQDRSAELLEVLARSFQEVFRNCFEHGASDSAVFCAQYWRSRDTVEICIADRGIGVCESLSQSKYTKPESDEQALGYALMPGVSSKAWRHKKKRASQRSVWDNAGYGLFFAHQLFGKLGHFYIASGESSLYLDSEKYMHYPCAIEGTLVSMRMSLSDESRIVDALRDTQKSAAKVKERLGVKSLDYKSVQAFLKSGE